MYIDTERCIYCGIRARPFLKDSEIPGSYAIDTRGNFRGGRYWFCSVSHYEKSISPYIKNKRFDLKQTAIDDEEIIGLIDTYSSKWDNLPDRVFFGKSDSRSNYDSEIDYVRKHTKPAIDEWNRRKNDELHRAENEFARVFIAELKFKQSEESAKRRELDGREAEKKRREEERDFERSEREKERQEEKLQRQRREQERLEDKRQREEEQLRKEQERLDAEREKEEEKQRIEKEHLEARKPRPISLKLKFEHTHILGSTGSGKSTLLVREFLSLLHFQPHEDPSDRDDSDCSDEDTEVDEDSIVEPQKSLMEQIEEDDYYSLEDYDEYMRK